MHKLKLTLVLRGTKLHLLVKGAVFEFDLNNYGFDTTKPISAGVDGNHLFRENGPIKDVKTSIKSVLGKFEKLMYSLNLQSVSGVFVSDRNMNNLAIKHFIDFLEQLNCRIAGVYTDESLSKTDAHNYMTTFNAENCKEYLVGKAGENRVGYWFKIPDDSISKEL